MKTIAQRIIEVVNATEGKFNAFATEIGVVPAYLSKIKANPDLVPSDRLLQTICDKYNVSEKWLRTGEGEMFRSLSREAEIAAGVGRILAEEDDTFRKRFIAAVVEFDEDEWKLLEKMAKKLAGI
ncbi:MAG: XRE family transcriptional regulator [Oscillospiraceae bacterium]|nr:XRE family transcriptional regulator [Oscillospiraceae bacterium]